MTATLLPPFFLSLFDGQSGWLAVLTSVSIFLASVRYLLSSLSSTFGVDLLEQMRRLLQRSTYQVEVDSATSPRLYNQVMAFLSSQPSFSSRVRVVCAVLNDGFSAAGEAGYTRMFTNYRRDPGQYTEAMMERITDEVRKADRKSGKQGSPSQISYCPGFYTHTLQWREQGSDGATAPLEVTVEVRRGAPTPTTNAMSISPGSVAKPVLVLTVRLHEQLRLQRLLREAEATYNVSLAKHVLTFSPSDGGHALDYTLTPKRDPSTLVLCHRAAALFSDAASFFTERAKAFYAARHLPYRRGYLLYGAPGTGKSSFVLALASHLQCPVYIVSLTESAMTDAVLRMVLCRVPAGSIILLEDVDCLFEEKEKEAPSGAAPANPAAAAANRTQRQRVTLSGVLNALDGVGAQQGSLVIMTTNHLALLDDALIRAGRVDEAVEFTLPDTQQAVEAFTKLHLPQQPYHGPAHPPPEGGLEVAELTLPKSSRALQDAAAAIEYGWMSRPLQEGELAQLQRSVLRVFDERQYHSGLPPFLSYADLQAIFLSSHRHPLCRCFPQLPPTHPTTADSYPPSGADEASSPLLSAASAESTPPTSQPPPPTLACAVQFVVLLREREPMKKLPPSDPVPAPRGSASVIVDAAGQAHVV